MAPATSPTAITSFLLGNLHCPSCVALIKDHLRHAYPHHVLWVSPNLVTSVVAVEHTDGDACPLGGLEEALKEIGFEVCGIYSTAGSRDGGDSRGLPVAESSHHHHQQQQQQQQQQQHQPRRSVNTGSWFDLWRPADTVEVSQVARQMHMQNCEACRAANDEQAPTWASEKPSTPVAEHRESSSPRSANEPFTAVRIDKGNEVDTRKMTLSIGGMTCAVCANTITERLEQEPWISKVVVNLLADNATIHFHDQSRQGDVAEIVEDMGYEATVDSITDLNQRTEAMGQREVEIAIDGLFCPRCPERIYQTLKSFDQGQLEIVNQLSLGNPITKIRYVPHPPQFTIRHLLKAIEAADPSLRASIHHPPTLEQRSKAVRAKHQRQLLVRTLLTLCVAVPTFIIGIVFMSLVPESNSTRQYLMQPWTSGLSRLDVALCLLATPVYFFAADLFHVRAVKEMRTLWCSGSRTPISQRLYKFGSMNMLISLGTTIAYVSSVAQMVAAAARNRPVSEDHLYFDSVVFLTLFLLLGKLIEGYSKSKAGDAVEKLAKLRPDTAVLIEHDKLQGQFTTSVPVDQLECGDLIKVLHGASPPADAEIVAGQSTFNESSLTGESRPVSKDVGDKIFAGTINDRAVVTARITGAPGRSMLDQIVDVVREGQTKRAPVEHAADTLTSYFVPAITLIALSTWVIWMALSIPNVVDVGSDHSMGARVAFAFRFAIAVFVVACPCGLALAAPTAFFVGGGLAARHGVLAKGGGEAFEKASRVDCVVFDKTGTLTMGGEPKVEDAELFLNETKPEIDKELLRAALRATEENSTHPIARAIVAFCKTGVSVEVRDVEELPGRGIKASFTTASNGRFDIAVGNEHIMRDISASLSDHIQTLLQKWKTEAKSIVLAAIKPKDADSWTFSAALSISDPIRPEARGVISILKARGTQVWMLSGDNLTTAKAVAGGVGIPESNVLAEVLPVDKAERIKYLQTTLSSPNRGNNRRAAIAMVGDGINDAPALAAADVGIAIGSGSDVAVASAHFVLAQSGIASVPMLLDISRAVLRRVRANFAWAVAYNLAAVPIAAGCLYAVRTAGGGHVVLDPVWASLAMALSSVSVVLSSLSLRTRLPLIGFRNRWPREE